MSLLLNNSADLEKKLRELAQRLHEEVTATFATIDGPQTFYPSLSEAAAFGRAEGRLEQFLVMKNERPIDSCYWDRHEERSIREKVKNV